MSNNVPADGDAPQEQKKWYHALNIILVALSILVLCWLLINVYRGLAPRVDELLEPTDDIMAKLHLASQCQELKPNLSMEECGQWSVGLKRDHPDDFRECVGDPNDEVLELGGMYECFVDKGLGPKK